MEKAVGGVHGLFPAYRTWVALLVLLVCCGLVYGEVTIVESWDEGVLNGWQSYDLVHEREGGRVAVDGDAVVLRYPAQSIKMPPEHYVIRATGATSGGRFVGDYLAAEAVLLRLRLWVSHVPQAHLILYDGNMYWRHALTGLKAGQWHEIDVPVTPAMLVTYRKTIDATAFTEALQHVQWVGVSIERNSSMEAQEYRLDEFRMVCGSDAFDVWMRQYVGESAALLPDADLDGDGVSNWHEWVAGTAADQSRDLFRVQLGRSAGNLRIQSEGLALRWPSEEGRVYTVWRTDDLAEDFVIVADGVAATPPENSFVDDRATGQGAVFYRVTVQREDTP